MMMARAGSEGGRDAPEEERYRRRGASVAQPRDLKSDGWFVGSCGTLENEDPRREVTPTAHGGECSVVRSKIHGIGVLQLRWGFGPRSHTK